MAKSDTQRSYEKYVLKTKPKGITKGEDLYQGSTAKWSHGRYRKQAEAEESKERKAYRKDNPLVKKGNSPIEGTKEEYVRRNQVKDKLSAYNKRKTASSTGGKRTEKSKATRKKMSLKR